MKWSKKSKSSSKSSSVHWVALLNVFWQCWTDLLSIQALKFLNVEFEYLLINSSRDRD